jgi:hypothetical protein
MARPYAQSTRNDTLIGSIAVSFVRYMQHLVFFDDEYGHGDVRAIDKTKEQLKISKFPHSVFRHHVENAEQLITPALHRYAEELFDYLTEEMLQAGHLEKKGDGLVGTIPLNEYQRKRWLKRKLDQWKADLL